MARSRHRCDTAPKSLPQPWSSTYKNRLHRNGNPLSSASAPCAARSENRKPLSMKSISCCSVLGYHGVLYEILCRSDKAYGAEPSSGKLSLQACPRAPDATKLGSPCPKRRRRAPILRQEARRPAGTLYIAGKLPPGKIRHRSGRPSASRQHSEGQLCQAGVAPAVLSSSSRS